MISINKRQRNMHKYTCKLFENFGYRQAIIKKAITYKFSQDMEDYSIIDILTHKLNDDRELSEDVLYELGLKRVKARQYFYIIRVLVVIVLGHLIYIPLKV